MCVVGDRAVSQHGAVAQVLRPSEAGNETPHIHFVGVSRRSLLAARHGLLRTAV